MLPVNLGSETNSKLPFLFIVYSLTALIISQILLLLNGQIMAGGEFEIPAIWSSAHLLILGWALMVAMGAMYQLVPVAFLTKIWSEKFGYAQFIISSLGIAGFTAMLYQSPQLALVPGILTVLGILMFLFQMFMTLRTQAKPSILTLFVGTALVFLFLTISLGITLLFNLTSDAVSGIHEALFKSHLLIGITGWFTLLIFGFSYKMVPMFSLSHGFSMAPAKYVYGIYVSGLVISLVSFFTGQSIFLKIGFFLLLAGFTLFTWHIRLIIKKRLKKTLDKPFSFALLAIVNGNVLHLTAFVLVMTNNFANLTGPFIYAYLLLWIVLSIVGYLHKIVPFLWWTHKYSKQIGKDNVPLLKEMMNEKLVPPVFMGFIIGAFLVFLALLAKNVTLFNIGQWVLSVSLIIMAVSILNVLRK